MNARPLSLLTVISLTACTQTASTSLSETGISDGANPEAGRDAVVPKACTGHGTCSADCWCVVPGPSAPVVMTYDDAWGVGADDFWIGGASGGCCDSVSKVALHWNGTTFASVDFHGPVASGCGPSRPAVAFGGSSANDIWAAGSVPGCKGRRGFGWINHWDGSSWSNTSSDLGAGGSTAGEVSASSATDAWAVNGGHLFHWNGSVWTEAAIDESNLQTVWAVSSTDVWVGGSREVMRHWNGSTWTSHPVSAGGVSGLHGLSTSDVWALGEGVFLHWDGVSWSMVPAVSPPVSHIAGTVSNDLWAVSTKDTVLHWDGVSWSPTTTGGQQVTGVVAFGRDAWAFGSSIVRHYAE